MGLDRAFNSLFNSCFHFRFTLHLRNVQLCELWPCPCTWNNHVSLLSSLVIIVRVHKVLYSKLLFFFYMTCATLWWLNEASPKVYKPLDTVCAYIHMCVLSYFKQSGRQMLAYI